MSGWPTTLPEPEKHQPFRFGGARLLSSGNPNRVTLNDQTVWSVRAFRLAIERESLKREIASRTLSPDHRVEAIERCDQSETECAQLLAELETVRHSHL
jgi:hypothetical protein